MIDSSEFDLHVPLLTTGFDPEIRLENHIFIYSPCGRTGSTALQRILNSSNEVCIWGEPYGFDTFVLGAIHKLNELHQGARVPRQEQTQQFLQSFKEQNHDKFYPLAFRPLDRAAQALEDVFTSMLMPVNGAKRFGYKNIDVSDVDILKTLRLIYPNCYLLFLFRNPMPQWISVRDATFFPYSNNLDQFLNKYHRISDILINYFEEADRAIFVENKVLLDPPRLHKLLTYLEISNIDEEPSSKIISSIAKGPLSDEERNTILTSKAYSNFEKMLMLADRF
ncbi:MAG TPA: sulfotransferase [Vicinamibacteria bacterium]|nr:sulfotransferase [Vicinamibacteria bacterium]